MEQQETDNIIHSIVEKLPLHFRTVVTLRDIKGFSYEEIAVKTGLNINTLRVNLSRARNIIREEYNKYHNEKRGIRQASRKIL
jgi:RNA polymerase sigma-70 factor (ECF subfamily)